MSDKKLNDIFGYGFFTIGMLKLLLIILILIQFGSNMASIFSGGTTNSEYYPVFIKIVNWGELILGTGSIIMIIKNLKKDSGPVNGYFWGVGAVLLGVLLPPILAFFSIFMQCGMYIKAGSKITDTNFGSDKNYIKIKQDAKNAEWFYGNDDK